MTQQGDADDDPHTEAVLDALNAAVRRATGSLAASADIVDALYRLDNTRSLGVMAAWVALANYEVPLPAPARADYEPRIGGTYDLAAATVDIALGCRLFAALANEDIATANALWETAINTKIADEVLMVVLHRAASVIAHPAGEAQ